MKTLLIAVSILALASLSLIFVGKQQKNSSVTPSPNNAQTVVPTNMTTATLRVTSEKTVLQPGEEASLDVYLTGMDTLRVTGVHNEFTYDPTKIEIVDVTPGDYFNNPIELAKVIDPVKKSLVYAVGTLSEELKMPQSSVFSIHIKALSATQNAQKVISYNQTNSDVGLINKADNQMVLDTQKTVLFEEPTITIQQ